MQHLAIIMDGNRRWAKKEGLFPWEGHRQGLETVKRTLTFCLKNNIPYLSLYAFSIENFKRSDQERSFLFDILGTEIKKQLNDFLRHDIKIRFIGDRSLFPFSLKDSIEEVELATSHCKALNVQLFFCYGARQELVASVKDIVLRAQQGLIQQEDISEQLLHDSLWTKGIPEPDLIVRTGGAQRISNFLLYQAAYSELYFLDCFWPEVGEEHLNKACEYFQQCKRNFGS